jgi:GNAT superfamily N-acetyltransferase
MSLLLTKASLTTKPWLLDEALNVISQDAEFLRSSYPQFDKWFASKVLPGIIAGERTLLIEERDSTAVGLLILKHTSTEKKLCTLRVRPHYESKGLGVRLFQTAFELLGTERPLLSVSQPAEPKFHRLFTYFGFAKEAVYQGRYLPMVDELAYNGLLDGLLVNAARPTLVNTPTPRKVVRRHKASCRSMVCACPV